MLRRVLSSKLTALVVALVGVPGIIGVRALARPWDLNDLRAAIETEASFRVRRAVYIGGISGNPWLGITLTDVAISRTAGDFRAGTFASAKAVRLRYRGRDVLAGTVLPLRSIESIEIDGLSAEIIRRPDGSWNFEDMLRPKREPTNDRFQGRITLRHSSVRFADALTKTALGPLEVNPTSVDAVADFADAARIAVSGALTGEREGVGRVNFRAEVAANGKSVLVGARGSSVDIPRVLAHIGLPEDTVSVEAGIGTASVQVAWAEGMETAYFVKGVVRGGRFRAPKHAMEPFLVDGPLTVTNGELRAEDASVRYGTSRATVTGSLLGLGSGGDLAYDAQLANAELDLRELLREWPLVPEGVSIECAEPIRGDFTLHGVGAQLILAGATYLPPMTVRTHDGTVVAVAGQAAEGRYAGTERQVAETRVDGALAEVALPPLFDPPEWLAAKDTSLLAKGVVDCRLTYDGEGLGVRARLKDGSGTLLGAAITDAEADVEVRAGTVRVPRFAAYADGARVTGEATAEFTADARRFRATALAEGLDLGALSRYVKIGDRPLGGIATVRAALESERQGQASALLRGRVEGLSYGDAAVEHVTFAARVRPGEVELPWVEVTDPRGSAQGALVIELPREDGGQVSLRDARILAAGLDIAALAEAVRPADAEWPAVGGTADFAGTVTGPIDSPTVAGKLQVTEPLYGDYSADSVLADFSADREEIVLGNLEVRRGYATLTANGTVSGYLPREEGASADPRLNLTATVARLSVGEALELAGQANDYDVAGLIYGEATIEGALEDLVGAGTVELRDGSVGDWPVRRAAADLSVAGTTLTIERLEAAVDEGALVARGTVHDWLNTRYMDVSWETSNIVLDPSRQHLSQSYGLSGEISARGHIAGTIDDFDATGHLKADEISVGGQVFRNASIDAKATRFSDSGTTFIDFGPARLEGAGGLVSSAGFWDSSTRAINMSVAAAGLHLSAIADLLVAWTADPVGMAPVTRVADLVGGELYGHVEIDGRPGDLTVTVARGRLEEATYQGEPIPSVMGTVEWSQARQRLSVTEFSAVEGDAVVKGSVDARLGPDGQVQGYVEATNVPLARVAPLFGAKDTLTGGTASLRLVAHGPTRTPSIEGSASLSSVEVSPSGRRGKGTRPIALERVDVTGLRLREGALEVAHVALGGEALGFTVSDVLIPFSWEQRGFVRDHEVRARAVLARQDLSAFAELVPAVQTYAATGSVEGFVEVRGTLDRPVLNGRLSVADGRLRWVPEVDTVERLLDTSAVEVTGLRGALVLSPGQGAERARVVVEGLEGEALGGRFSGGGWASLVSLAPLDPGNRYDLELTASGLSRRLFPGPGGIATLREVTASLAYDPVARQNTVTISRADLALGSGRISVTGSVSLDPKLPSDKIGLNRWDLRCEARSLPVNAKDLADLLVRSLGEEDAESPVLDVGRGLLDADLTVRSPGGRAGAPAVIAGDLTLHDAELRIPLMVPAGGGPALWTLTRDDFDLDAQLRIGDNVMLPQLKSPLEGQARLSGTLRRPALFGSLGSTGGSLSLLGRTWDVEHVGIEFQFRVPAATRTVELSARVEIRAATSVSHRGQRVRVMLGVTGPLGATDIRLTSEPSLPQQELLQLLGTGGDAAGAAGGRDGVAEMLSKDLGHALEGFVTEQAIKGLVGEIRRALGLERLSIEVGENTSVTGFDAEMEIAPGLFVRFRRGMGERSGQRELLLGVTYNLPYRGRAVLETTDLGEVRASLEAQWRF